MREKMDVHTIELIQAGDAMRRVLRGWNTLPHTDEGKAVTRWNKALRALTRKLDALSLKDQMALDFRIQDGAS